MAKTKKENVKDTTKPTKDSTKDTGKKSKEEKRKKKEDTESDENNGSDNNDSDSDSDSDNDNDNDNDEDAVADAPADNVTKKKGTNQRTEMANCTLNVKMLNKYCQNYLKNYCPHDKAIKTPNLDVAVGPCCESLFEYIVKGATNYAQKNDVAIVHKGKDVGTQNKYNVTLSCVRQAIDSDNYLCEMLGFTAQRFDHVSRDNMSHFLNQPPKVVDAYIASVLKSSQVNFDKEALNLICHLVETALTKMLVTANAFRGFAKGNTVGFKHFSHAIKLFLKGTLLNNVQVRLDEIQNKLDSNKGNGKSKSSKGKKDKKTEKTEKTKKKSKSKSKSDSEESGSDKSGSDKSGSESDSE